MTTVGSCTEFGAHFAIKAYRARKLHEVLHRVVPTTRFLKRRSIMWTKPEATDMRFGFEVTMYVCNR